MNHAGELWQEFANNGEPLKNVGASKSEFHNDLKTSGAVHVWIWRKAAMGGGVEVLIQRRSPKKPNDAWPNHWDNSASGHIDVGESLIDAVLRETKEEIDYQIDAEKLYFAFGWRTFLPLENDTIHWAFLYEVSGNEKFRFNDGEVDDLKWISVEKLREWISDKGATEKFVPHYDACFDQLFTHLNRVAAKGEK